MTEKAKSYMSYALRLLLLLPVLSGCNSDVFVEELDADVTELVLDGNGDERTVTFTSDRISYVSIFSTDDRNLYQTILDADGNSIPVPTDGNIEVGCKGVWSDEFLSFSIEKLSDRECRIAVEENAYATPYEFYFNVGNDYQNASVKVRINPSDRYQVDDIEYFSTSRRVYDEYERLLKEWRVANDSDSPMTVALDVDDIVYEGDYRFEEEEFDLFSLMADGAVEVDVYSFDDRLMGLYGVKAPFGSEYARVTLPGPPSRVRTSVEIAPKTTEVIRLYAEMEDIGVSIIVHGKNMKNGRECVRHVLMRAVLPTGVVMRRGVADE